MKNRLSSNVSLNEQEFTVVITVATMALTVDSSSWLLCLHCRQNGLNEDQDNKWTIYHLFYFYSKLELAEKEQ